MKDFFEMGFYAVVIILALCLTIIINHSKDVELEKYKIQMQTYGEQVQEK